MRKALMMTGKSGSRGSTAKARRGAISAIFAAAILAGCGTTVPPGVEPIDYTVAPRDLVAVVSVPDSLVVRLGRGGHIDKREQDRLDAYVADVAANRPESLRVMLHGPATPAQFRAVADALIADGV